MHKGNDFASLKLSNSSNVGAHLIERLKACGISHVFGVPGDYVLGFFKQLSDSEISLITTCDELSAGYAADAYARIRGIGAVCVTYSVGGLKVVNAAAQAYAEKSPLVIIAGAPGITERVGNPLLHHKVRTFETQKKVFEEVTVASTVLDNPQNACREIERVLAEVLRLKRPGYIEVPRDLVFAPIEPSCAAIPDAEGLSNPDTLDGAVEEAVMMINEAEQPVIIAGIELHRFRLQDKLDLLANKVRLPVAATILAKSVIGEYHPLYIGIYEGAMGFPSVRDYVESSDCLIILGAFMTDVNLGQYTANIDQNKAIYVTSEQCFVRNRTYPDVCLPDFIDELIAAPLRQRTPRGLPQPRLREPFKAHKGQKITVKRLFDRLNWALEDNTVVVADVGDALFGGLDLITHRRTEFLSPGYYLSLGFAVPASLGAQLADSNLRPLVLVGDGAFQMTGFEVSTIARLGLNPVIVVLNNFGYATERPLQDGPFNDLQVWQYSRIPEIVGGGRGVVVTTEDELEQALKVAQANVKEFTIIDVQLDPRDSSPALKRLTESLAKKIR
ncbi:MAG TPA: thiamine pyrophosphate-binding protein [Candidatus Acidoferrales bacterium]|nr:thiamine pyrophosphate-binding protein [Candidatus Acidoferrales bacterium]